MAQGIQYFSSGISEIVVNIWDRTGVLVDQPRSISLSPPDKKWAFPKPTDITGSRNRPKTEERLVAFPLTSVFRRSSLLDSWSRLTRLEPILQGIPGVAGTTYAFLSIFPVGLDTAAHPVKKKLRQAEARFVLNCAVRSPQSVVLCNHGKKKTVILKHESN